MRRMKMVYSVGKKFDSIDDYNAYIRLQGKIFDVSRTLQNIIPASHVTSKEWDTIHQMLQGDEEMVDLAKVLVEEIRLRSLEKANNKRKSKHLTPLHVVPKNELYKARNRLYKTKLRSR